MDQIITVIVTAVIVMIVNAIGTKFGKSVSKDEHDRDIGELKERFEKLSEQVRLKVIEDTAAIAAIALSNSIGREAIADKYLKKGPETEDAIQASLFRLGVKKK